MTEASQSGDLGRGLADVARRLALSFRRGEVALAIQQVSELMAIEGVEIVGPVPEAINTRAVFSAALFAGADPRAAALLDWLAAAMTAELLRAGGLEPA